MLACVEVHDKRSGRSRDPGQTGKIHRGFRAAADMQLRGLREALRQAVIDINVLGLSGPSNFTFMAPEARLNQFAGWLETAANASLDARWWVHPWIERATQHGLNMAQKELRGRPYLPTPTSFETLHHLAHHELRGIISALVQKVIRQAHRVTARRLVPHKAFHDLVGPIDKEIHNRLHAFAQTFTVKGHIHGKVAYYRQAGLTHVGINPELKGPKRRVLKHDHAMRDDDPAEAVWQTAEDEDVCDDCEEMAAGSPYTLDEIYDLIPLHINCRCDAIVWDDAEIGDSMTVDGFDPDEPRNEHGEWTSGGSSQANLSAFKNWFGNSKVVDQHGKPLVVYHGSSQVIGNKFSEHKIGTRVDFNKGYLGHGFYFSSAKTASIYGESPEGGNVTPVFLSLQNPLKIDAQFLPKSERRIIPVEIDRAITVRHALAIPENASAKDVTKAAKALGHDGIIYNYRGDYEYVVFDPTKIKSAIGNKGSFDPKSEDISDAQQLLLPGLEQ